MDRIKVKHRRALIVCVKPLSFSLPTSIKASSGFIVTFSHSISLFFDVHLGPFPLLSFVVKFAIWQPLLVTIRFQTFVLGFTYNKRLFLVVKPFACWIPNTIYYTTSCHNDILRGFHTKLSVRQFAFDIQAHQLKNFETIFTPSLFCFRLNQKDKHNELDYWIDFRKHADQVADWSRYYSNKHCKAYLNTSKQRKPQTLSFESNKISKSSFCQTNLAL